jgi:hydroxymethylpyrimidine kinase / phosphomethylpyrimidine kinase / thiamine-phosphate diphosphorylase
MTSSLRCTWLFRSCYWCMLFGSLPSSRSFSFPALATRTATASSTTTTRTTTTITLTATTAADTLTSTLLTTTTTMSPSSSTSVNNNNHHLLLPPSLNWKVPPPIVYTLAGSDSGGGAGIQADLHAIHTLGGHGATVITCVTAQNSQTVTAVHTIPLDMVQTQWQTLLDDLPPRAIKIGMLGSRDMAVTVGNCLSQLRNQQQQSASSQKVWIVLDPVMISTSGHRLIQEDAQQAMIEHVFPHVDLLTPNKFEAEALLGRSLFKLEDVEQGARDLLTMGVAAVYLKGGHQFCESKQNDSSSSITEKDNEETNWALDYFLSSSSQKEASAASLSRPRLCDCIAVATNNDDGISNLQGVWLRSTRYDTQDTHGTGCTLSSSLATVLALGEAARSAASSSTKDVTVGGAFTSLDLVDAACVAKAYVTAGIARSQGRGRFGQGPGPVAHTSFPHTAEHFPSIVPAVGSSTSRAFVPWTPLSSSPSSWKDQGGLIPIVDSVEWVQRLCTVSSITDIQLRIKTKTPEPLTPDTVLSVVQAAQDACSKANVRLWVNDYWEAAVQCHCYAVHLGQEDLYDCVKAGGVAQMQAKGMALGISTHSFGELSVALGMQPSYISVGPIFATSSKKVAFDPQGLSVVALWRSLIPEHIPLVVIGGINDAETVAQVRAAGADGVAVIGAVTQSSDVPTAVAKLQEAMRSS